MTRKANSDEAIIGGGYNNKVVFGLNANDGTYSYMVPYLGGSVYLTQVSAGSTVISNYPNNSSFANRTYVNYNLAGAPVVDSTGNPLYGPTGDRTWYEFRSIQLPKYANPIITTSYNSYQNFSSALELIPSGGTSNWYIAIIDGELWRNGPNNPYSKCALYVYNIFRVPDFDGIDINNNRNSYGFQITPMLDSFGWSDTSNNYTISYSVRTQNRYHNGDWADMLYNSLGNLNNDLNE